jgi:GTPase Era involved in 16S rRNA processing
MKKELERIISTYEINELKNDLEAVTTVENIYIGVLGEFSSGKSSLLNSILGKKVLPAMDKATTKSITYLKSDIDQESAIEYFEIQEDDSEEKISLIEYQDIAKGNRSGEALVSVKSNDFLNKGYVFVDTPGVSSLDQTDIDITYGLLPKLDGILICIDCNTGSLNASLKSFLESPEIEMIKDKILFVLTKSDQKTTDSINKIIDGFKNDINHYLKVDDMDNRIISFSSNNVLEEGNRDCLEKLLSLFEVSINFRKKQMIDLRLKKQEEILKAKIVDALKDLKNKLSFDDTQFKIERVKLESDIESLSFQKSELKKKLAKFEYVLLDDMKTINESFGSKIRNECSNVTPNEDALNDLYSQYTQQASNIVSTGVERFFKEHNIIEPNSLNVDFSELSSNVSSIIKKKEIITGLVTSVAIAAATGGTSLAANAVETGGAMAVQAAGQAVEQTIVKEVVKEGVKTVIKQGAKKLALDFILGLGEKAKEINPIEHLGAFLAKKQIESSLDITLPAMGRKICTQTLMSIEDQIETVFEGIDERLKIHQNNLDLAFENMKKSKGEVEKLKSKIEGELIRLS